MIETILFFQLIKTGYYDYEDKNELAQRVYLYLTEKEDKILNGYLKKAKFTTYLSVIIINKCSEFKEEKIRRDAHFDTTKLSEQNRILVQLSSADLSAEEVLAINDYIIKLDLILKTYPKNKSKIIISFKALYRILILLREIQFEQLPQKRQELIKECVNILNDLTVNLTDQKIYLHLTDLFYQLESKSKSVDAIRKWIEDKIKEIICLLNGNPPQASFDKETLKFLFEYYCKKMEENLQNDSEVPSILQNSK